MAEQMVGGRFSDAQRDDRKVLRRASGPNSTALLKYFEEVGFSAAPRYLGRDGDRDVLNYIDGTVGWPPFSDDLRSDEALVSVVTTVREMHDYTEGFQPPQPEDWSVLDVAGPLEIDCIGHNDLSPWNIVFQGRQVAGIIDWDTAAPSSRSWDLAFAAYQFVPLYPPAWLAGFGWPSEPDRNHRLKLIAQTYGRGMRTDVLLDLALVRLASLAAKMEQEISNANPAFRVMAEENHADGVRASIAYLAQNRLGLLA